jgi:thiosulfate dehydrogenase (quinone) large subunit
MSRSVQYTITLLRVSMGYLFLSAGLDKVLAEDGWSAKGYLMGANGPFASLFQSLAGLAWVDAFNMWGLTLIGAALMLGVAVRWSSFWGSVLMVLYYFAHFETNTANGLIDDHLVYALVLILFIVVGAGKWWGLDGRLKTSSGVRRWMMSGS